MAAIAWALAAGLLSAGCTFHTSPIKTWYFYDLQTGQPIENVLLLEWAEKSRSRSPEAQAFERQVPAADTLKSVRGRLITRAEPHFRPKLRTKIQAYALTVTERSRFMAARADYSYRVRFANQEQLAKLGVEGAADESIAYVVLTPQPKPTDAVDWLHWLTNGRSGLAGLDEQQRRQVYTAFGAYWDRTAGAQGMVVSAELAPRPPELAVELTRIYREELNRTPPKLP